MDIVMQNGDVATSLSDGSYFGEICLLTNARRVARCAALLITTVGVNLTLYLSQCPGGDILQSVFAVGGPFQRGAGVLPPHEENHGEHCSREVG